MRYDLNYGHYDLFVEFEEILGNLDLIQMVDFTTWSRIVNNALRSSILDHVKDFFLGTFQDQESGLILFEK